ncbi:MAG: methionyl-tRNA formyltransferase [Paraglaciecola sp.]
MNSGLNIVFAGTPDFAATHLQALIASKHNIIAVYTQPDRPAGRGKKLQASAVKQLALDHNIDVLQPSSLKTDEAQEQLASLQADVMIVVAYGLILPQKILQTPTFGCLNIHGSLLPKWRGAAPIQRAIWAGDKQTGVTVMQMDKGLDTGPMLCKKSLDITEHDTSATLYQKLAELGPIALLETLCKFDTLTPEPQDETLACYAPKLSKQEANVDWTVDAAQLARNVRAFNPWPVVYFSTENIAVKIWQARVVNLTDQYADAVPGEIVQANKEGIIIMTGKNLLLIDSLQLPGKKNLPVRDILNGYSELFTPGKVLQ